MAEIKTEKKCKISEILEESGYEPHDVILGHNVWKQKKLYAVWHSDYEINGGGVQLLYTEEQYSKERCENDIKMKLKPILR